MKPDDSIDVPRRTQAQRSHFTTGRLLDSAVHCLIERGYAGLTTTLVAEKTGVSRGALLHHFPSRAALVDATIRHVFARLTAEFQLRFESLEPGVDRAHAGLDLLWSAYACDENLAALDLYVAARTDPELVASIQPAAVQHRANVFRLARLYFPDLATDPRFDLGLETLGNTLMGLAVQRALRVNDSPLQDSVIDFLHTLYDELFPTSDTEPPRHP